MTIDTTVTLGALLNAFVILAGFIVAFVRVGGLLDLLSQRIQRLEHAVSSNTDLAARVARDPAVYTVIFEDANFRVIQAVRKKGVKDKPHSHLLPSAVYQVNDCKSRPYSADGKSVERDTKGGTSSATPITPSHAVENIGASDCT